MGIKHPTLQYFLQNPHLRINKRENAGNSLLGSSGVFSQTNENAVHGIPRIFKLFCLKKDPVDPSPAFFMSIELRQRNLLERNIEGCLRILHQTIFFLGARFSKTHAKLYGCR